MTLMNATGAPIRSPKMPAGKQPILMVGDERSLELTDQASLLALMSAMGEKRTSPFNLTALLMRFHK
jgi:hypothetical protein